MAKTKNIEDLREMLFDAAERLKNAKDGDLDAELLRARGIGALCGVIVETVKVEVAHIKVTGGEGCGSTFLPQRASGALQEEKPTPRLLGGKA